MDQTLMNKIVRGNGHNHYVIDPDDKDAFLAAGFVLAGTVSQGPVIQLVVRQKGDYERNDINPSARPDNFYSRNADPTGATVGQVEVNVTSPSGDDGGSGKETGSPSPSDADAGVSDSGN